MAQASMTVSTVAEAFLRLLARRGVDYLFANAGTDFAPLIEAYARCAAHGLAVPDPVTVPHENVAVHMALGYWAVTGRTQAVMVHVNVGTANAVCGLLNAIRAEVPILFVAGRTPITESGRLGSRNLHIHWTQEMFDQASLVREAVKWDYELRHPSQLETVVDRALGIAETEPRGPVYLTLPRELLAEPLEAFAFADPARHGIGTGPHPDPAAIDVIAERIGSAERPVVVTSGSLGDREARQALERFASACAMPVVQHAPRTIALSTDHPMHAGYRPDRWLTDADLVLVVDCPVPWIPDRVSPPSAATIVQIGPDPLHQRIPVRGFPCDIALTASPSAALTALEHGCAGRLDPDRIARRRERLARDRADAARARRDLIERVRHERPIHPAWLTHCVDAILGVDGILVREAPQVAFDHLTLTGERRLISAAGAGGLGWGLGAALGAKLAAPDRLVVAVEGDGSYLFGEPVSAHYVALERRAPFLTVICNNRRWNEVRSATRHVYPDGEAARAGAYEPLTRFDPALSLHRVIDCVGGHGEQVTDPAALPAALARAVERVANGDQAVVDVICSS